MDRRTAPRRLDFFPRIFERFQLQDILQVKSERTGDVVLQRCRTKDFVRSKAVAQIGNDAGRSEQAVVR
jgi:hypothetical protein